MDEAQRLADLERLVSVLLQRLAALEFRMTQTEQNLSQSVGSQ